MRVDATHDIEDEDLDPVEPLGDLLIEDDQENKLVEGAVWLDEWFTALIYCIQAIAKGKSEAIAEMGSHREPLAFKAAADGITIRFKSSELIVRDLTGFVKLLRKAVMDFTGSYLLHENWPKNKDLSSAREWAESGWRTDMSG